MSSDTNIPETDVQNTPPSEPDIFGMKPNTYCMLLHLSQLLGIPLFPFGFAVPIVLWAIGKDKSPQVDIHGKIVINWIISAFVYGLVLTVTLIGILLLPVLFILGIVFSVIGAVNANEGTIWKYPLSIAFFK
jgi:uncharacterized Tic20 family protein